MQSAAIRASVLPSTAKIESIEWKMDGEVAEGSGTTLAFSSQSVGEHTVVCTVNGVDSAPLTIQVTEPSEEEKNSLFYENFDALSNGSQWGSFAHTNASYNRYDIVFVYPSGEDGTLLDTTMGDLWMNGTVTTLTTDNDAKTITRVAEASESGDYSRWAALNYADMSADCRKIVVTLGEGTSCNMVMIQVQNADGSQIIDQNWGVCEAGDELIIELTAEQAQKMCDTTNQYFMIWPDANSGNGCGTLVIESVQFFAAAE